MSFDFINTTEQLVGHTALSLLSGRLVLPRDDVRHSEPAIHPEIAPLENQWLKVQWNRSGSSPHMAFASEQMIDELAHAANMDPIAFRLLNLTTGTNGNLPPEDEQISSTLLPLLNAVTKAANWTAEGGRLEPLRCDGVVTGRGFAWFYDNSEGTNSQAATVVDLEVNKKTGKIVVKHVYQGVSAGLIISPGLVENQIVGAMNYIASRTLVEQLRFSKTNVTSLDWVELPDPPVQGRPQGDSGGRAAHRSAAARSQASPSAWPPRQRSRTPSSTRQECGCGKPRSRPPRCGRRSRRPTWPEAQARAQRLPAPRHAKQLGSRGAPGRLTQPGRPAIAASEGEDVRFGRRGRADEAVRGARRRSEGCFGGRGARPCLRGRSGAPALCSSLVCHWSCAMIRPPTAIRRLLSSPASHRSASAFQASRSKKTYMSPICCSDPVPATAGAQTRCSVVCRPSMNVTPSVVNDASCSRANLTSSPSHSCTLRVMLSSTV